MCKIVRVTRWLQNLTGSMSGYGFDRPDRLLFVTSKYYSPLTRTAVWSRRSARIVHAVGTWRKIRGRNIDKHFGKLRAD
jgi:hypothetical protein